jgi:transcriptional regulator with XRE-family HTH domain
MSPIRRMGKRLKALRLERGMTQAELAKRAGISRKHVIRIEAAEQEPTLGVIERLAKALKVRPAELLE